ncbi:MAG: 2-polyprenylphenol 6-hydroxylase [Alphaproteobacteria bacterium]
MLRTLRSLLRLLAIARTLARHDVLGALEELRVAPTVLWLVRRVYRRRATSLPGDRPGQKLARALTDLGPSFIKLGQFLSTRADLLGEQLAADLSDLQDRLPPFPSKAARATIESELGQPLSELFRSFDDTPISAASIAQVHLATVADPGGEAGDGSEGAPDVEVAIKVLRPGIERAFERDLELLYWVAGLAERTQPRLRRFKLVDSVRMFEQTVRIEMDLRMEAAAAAELADNFAEDPSYHVPRIDWQRTSRRVLTMARIDGIRLDDRAALLAAGHDLTEVLTKAAAIFFNQVFRDGFFHGDQHPGNMFVDAQGNIVAVDFGIMGRLDHKTRTFLAEMLLALLARDYPRLAEIHFEAGFLPAGQPRDTFAQALRSVSEPIFDRSLNEISFARLLARMLQLTEAFDMPVQPQLLVLQKNMMMAEGVSRRLDSTLNIWTLAEPLIEAWMVANRGPEARARGAIEELGRTLERLPRLAADAERLASELAGGGLRLHPDSLKALGGHGSGPSARWAFWIALTALAVALLAV